MNFRTPSCLSLCMRVSALFLLFAAGAAGAVEFNGYAVLTTDYVFRGVTYSDGHAAAQIGADVAFDSGLYIGAWASTIDIEVATIADRDLEADFYVGYNHPLTDSLTLGGTLVAYTFPNAEGRFDYDYEEYVPSLNYDDRAWVEYAYSPDVFGSGAETHNYAVFGELGLPGEFVASAGLGFYDLTELSGSDYSYWELGIGRPVGRISLDLRYHDADDWVPIWSSPDRVDSRIVLSAELRF